MQKDIKNNQHADDMTFALNDINSFNIAISTVEDFNRLGCLKHGYTTVGGILLHVTNETVRCLGISIGHNEIQCYEFNWSKISNDMQKLFESWKKRKLTIFSKACIGNYLGISQLIYKASIFPFPDPELI